MKILKIVAIGLVVLVLGGFLTVKYFLGLGAPKVDGKIYLPHLKDEVTVLRDKYGIPHIYAKNTGDLYYAMGFVQAQDRLFQMDFLRRYAKGELSEIFGEKTLGMDKYQRVAGFHIMEKKAYHNTSSEVKGVLNNFSRGINDYIELNKNNLPVEFHLLKYQPNKWSPSDTFAIGRLVSWDLTANWNDELLRYLTLQKVGKEKLDLFHPKIIPYGGHIVENINPKFAQKLLTSERLLQPASNNWVVSGKKSKSGKPILCNDPHLAHFLPSIFYQMHLVSEDLNVIGVSFPGVPFILLGQNKNIAWGATTTNADTSDLFIEKINPDNPEQYLYKNKWLTFDKRVEEIYVKKGGKKEVVKIEVLSSLHGPILNSAYPEHLKDSPPLSLCWTGYSSTNEGLFFLKIKRAKSVSEFFEALRHNEVPIQNWVIADIYGNIGFSPYGKIPIRKKGDGIYPVDGSSGEFDWVGFIPYEEMPRIYNPEDGIIVTANNKVIDQDKYKYIIGFDYVPSYRKDRISELLKAKDILTLNDMEKIQRDNYSKQGERVTKYFAEVCPQIKQDKTYKDACKTLNNWDFHTDVDNIGATIFYKVYETTVKNTLQDELGKDLLKLYYKHRKLENIFDTLIEKEDSVFFDDINTPEKEDKKTILIKSFKEGVDFLKTNYGNDVRKWRWGKIHTLSFSHPFSQIKALKKIFSLGPFERQGARQTVDMAYFEYGNKYFNTIGGAAFRFIVDMKDIENSLMVIDTGQSGNVKSKHFADQVNFWLKGEMIKTTIDDNKIEKNKEAKLILKPRKNI